MSSSMRVSGSLTAFLCLAAMSGVVRADNCRVHIGPSERAVSLNDIQNLMGRYAHLSHLRGTDTLEELFAMKQPDVSWRTPTGPQGAAGMRERFVKPGAAPRVGPPGQLEVQALLTPVIEVAADGRSAKGVWDAFGPWITRGSDVGQWYWVKYGVDFIREEGVWKIWHLQVYPLFSTPYDQSISQSAFARSIPGFPGGGAALPGAEDSGRWQQPEGSKWIYDGRSPPRGPMIPEPYCTWDPKTSYGNLNQ